MIPKNGIFGSRKRKNAPEQNEIIEVNKTKVVPAAVSGTGAAVGRGTTGQMPADKRRRRKPQEEAVRPSQQQIRDAEEKALRSMGMDGVNTGKLNSGIEKTGELPALGEDMGNTADSGRLDLPLPSSVPGMFDETRKAPDISVDADQGVLTGETKAVPEVSGELNQTPPRSVLSEDEPQDVFEEFGRNH